MDFVSLEDRGPVRWLIMSSPEAKNAIPKIGWTELADAYEEFEASGQRALVVAGADGDFSAGADLSADFSSFGTAAANAEYMRFPNRAALALHRISKPTIAAVDGVAVGAGMNLALGCDMVVATDRVRFSEIFVKRGLTLDFGGTWLLPRLVGLARARDIALTGRIVGAEEALSIGLVSRVVEVGALEDTVTELAEALADGAPLAQRFIKTALDRSSTMTFEQSLAYEEQAQSVLLGSEDLFEGASAFIQKRPPEFKGK
jgi:2-(1,2-epoxy-1,2-dihydrophenyl)acetyl-CoA isomerase